MSKYRLGLILFVLLCSLTIVSNTMAKVSPEEAGKLGKELTPSGAIKAGNAEGTIPAWGPDSASQPTPIFTHM